jgi:hypothetical protein
VMMMIFTPGQDLLTLQVNSTPEMPGKPTSTNMTWGFASGIPCRAASAAAYVPTHKKAPFDRSRIPSKIRQAPASSSITQTHVGILVSSRPLQLFLGNPNRRNFITFRQICKNIPRDSLAADDLRQTADFIIDVSWIAHGLGRLFPEDFAIPAAQTA